MVSRYCTPALVLAASIASADRSPQVPDPTRAGISGTVMSADERPISAGEVTLRSAGAETTARFGADGRFRIEPLGGGLQELRIRAPGFLSHRVNVVVPASHTLELPPTRLARAPYLKVRIVSPHGEPIAAPRILRQSFDVTGSRIPDEPGERASDLVDTDGAALVGPLPRGITVMAIDVVPFAQKPITDVRVTGETSIIDAGTVTLERGAELLVHVVDAEGTPVHGHEVLLDDGTAFPLIWRPPVRTDGNGNARFDRLASGRYRLRTRALQRCGDRVPWIERLVTIDGAGLVRERVVVGGVKLAIHLTFGGGPLPGARVSVTPQHTPAVMPSWLRDPFALRMRLLPGLGPPGDTPCGGTADEDGVATFSQVPPGPARAEVALPNSTWSRRIEVPAQAGTLMLRLPTGVLPLRVLDETGSPVRGAVVTWTSAGGRVAANTSATGDALLEGVADRPGTLAVRAPAHEPVVQPLAAPPDVRLDVTIARVPQPSLQCRVVHEDGSPIADAVVELVPADPMAVGQIAATDRRGLVRFSQLAAGSFRVVAHAKGIATSGVSVTLPLASTDPIAIVLSDRGRNQQSAISYQLSAISPFMGFLLIADG